MVVGSVVGDEWSRVILNGPEVVHPTESNPGGLLKIVSRSKVMLVMFRLAHHANDDGVCFPKVDTLAEVLGMSRRAVQAAIAYLKAVGLVSRSQRRREGRYFPAVTIVRRKARAVSEVFRRARERRRAELARQRSDRAAMSTRRREAIAATTVAEAVLAIAHRAQTPAPIEPITEYLYDHLSGQGWIFPEARPEASTLARSLAGKPASTIDVIARISAIRARKVKP